LIGCTGTPDPDCTGNYTYTGVFNGQALYQHQTAPWFLWYSTDYNAYLCTTAPGAGTTAPCYYWINQGLQYSPLGTYTPAEDAVGEITTVYL